MKIGIDGRSLESNPAGIGRYVFELCKCFDRLLPDAQFYLYTRGPLKIDLISSRWTLRHERYSILRKMKSIAWQRWFSGRMCREDEIDFYWGGATFLPLFLKSKVIKITSVHDLNHLLVPATMPTATFLAYKLFFKSDIKRADVVITSSLGTRVKLKDLCGIAADFVATPGVSAQFNPRTEVEISIVREKYKIGSGPYVLALSTLEPRKNLINLISAFLNQKKRAALPDYKLVLAGASGWKTGALDLLLADASDYVVRCGYVDDDDLPALYSGAKFFAFPSIYEGFGIPALEAVACGTTVLASDIPEIVEAAQGHGIFVGTDIPALENGLMTAASASHQHYSLVDIDWGHKAQVYINVFQNFKSGHK